MQQVASAQRTPDIAAPARLPALRPTSSRSLVARTWVLHGHLVTRIAAFVLAAAAIAGAYQFRDNLRDAGHAIVDLGAGAFSDAGLRVDRIRFDGLAITSAENAYAALGVEEGMSILTFDVDMARERLEALPAVSSAEIVKSYPAGLNVIIEEAVPVARWRVDGVTILVDRDGNELGAIEAGSEDLPLVIGDGAADDAAVIIELVQDFPLLERQLIAYSRIADRRWDLLYDNGLRIMLPETNPESALKLIEMLDARDHLLARDLQVLDMRVPGQLAIRLVERETRDDKADKS